MVAFKGLSKGSQKHFQKVPQVATRAYQYGFGLLHQYIGPLPVWVRIDAPVYWSSASNKGPECSVYRSLPVKSHNVQYIGPYQ